MSDACSPVGSLSDWDFLGDCDSTPASKLPPPMPPAPNTAPVAIQSPRAQSSPVVKSFPDLNSCPEANSCPEVEACPELKPSLCLLLPETHSSTSLGSDSDANRRSPLLRDRARGCATVAEDIFSRQFDLGHTSPLLPPVPCDDFCAKPHDSVSPFAVHAYPLRDNLCACVSMAACVVLFAGASYYGPSPVCHAYRFTDAIAHGVKLVRTLLIVGGVLRICENVCDKRLNAVFCVEVLTRCLKKVLERVLLVEEMDKEEKDEDEGRTHPQVRVMPMVTICFTGVVVAQCLMVLCS